MAGMNFQTSLPEQAVTQQAAQARTRRLSAGRQYIRDGYLPLFPFCRRPKMTSKTRAEIRRACERRWQRRNRHDPPGKENQQIPVPQG